MTTNTYYTTRPEPGAAVLYRSGNGVWSPAVVAGRDHDSPCGTWIGLEYPEGPQGANWATLADLRPFDKSVEGTRKA